MKFISMERLSIAEVAWQPEWYEATEQIYIAYFIYQLNAQILLFYNNMYVTLQSSTCFEH
jgi:hypothetical protein